MNRAIHRCGYVALVGRPNVGKSTLLNRILGEKLSIVGPKPQTTRHRILGVLTEANAQIIFVDTPGLHRKARRALNRSLNRAASSAILDADVAVMVVEALRWTDEDQDVLEKIGQSGIPAILVINKVDLATPREALLPFIDEMSRKGDFQEIVPLSALKDQGVASLKLLLPRCLPEGPRMFPEDQLTDRTERFIAAEVIREKLMRQLHQELPYGLTVEVEQYQEEAQGVSIAAVIWVERRGHKAIVIGKQGEQLKRAGRAARLELKGRLGRPVHLELWVKVLENWSDSERALARFGYE